MTLLELDGRTATLAARAEAVQAAFGVAAGSSEAAFAEAFPTTANTPVHPLPCPPSETARRIRALARAADHLNVCDLLCADGVVVDALAELSFSVGMGRLTRLVRLIRRAADEELACA